MAKWLARSRGERELGLFVSEVLPLTVNRLPAVVGATAVPYAGAVRSQLDGVPPTSRPEGVSLGAEHHG